MNDQEASHTMRKMLDYIKKQGDDQVKEVTDKAKEEFDKQLKDYIEEEKQRIVADYKTKLQQDEIRLKIQRSAMENNARIQKMKTVNQLVEKLYKDAKHKMVNDQKDTATYKELLKNLIIQGLIKLMEGDVHVRCRKSDLKICEEVCNVAGEEYKKLMKKEVEFFKDKEIPLKLHLDKDRFLPEYDDTEGAESCLGGLVLHAKKGRIVCSNTLDERLHLVYIEAIPEIRAHLFPNFKKKDMRAKPSEQPKHH